VKKKKKTTSLRKIKTIAKAKKNNYYSPRHKSLCGNPPNLRRLSDDFDAS